MRLIYCNNSDELADYEVAELEGAGYDNIIISYEQGCYEGDGYAIGVRADGADIWSLGHCSCYGPSDTYDRAEPIDLDDASIHSAVGVAENDEHGRAVLAVYRKMYQLT